MLPNKALWLTASQKIAYMTFVPRAVMRKARDRNKTINLNVSLFLISLKRVKHLNGSRK